MERGPSAPFPIEKALRTNEGDVCIESDLYGVIAKHA